MNRDKDLSRIQTDIRKPEAPRSEPNPKTDGPETGFGGDKIKMALLGAALVAGSAIGFLFTGTSGGDSMTFSERDRVQREFLVASQQPLVLGEVSKDQVPEKVAELGLAPQDAQKLLADVNDGKSRMLILGLVDFASEDGDIVSVSSSGLTVEVPLFKGINVVAIPVAGSGPAQITVTGVYDGGGGITVSGSGPNGQLPLPVMLVGESVSFNVQ